MTIVGRTFEEFKLELAKIGYTCASPDFFNDTNFIVFNKGGHSFAVEYQKFYNYRYIVLFFRNLGCEPPEDCLRVFNQEIDPVKRPRQNNKGGN